MISADEFRRKVMEYGKVVDKNMNVGNFTTTYANRVDEAGPSQHAVLSQSHSDIMFSYFAKAYNEKTLMDISVRCDGVLVRRAQRIVLAAFSNNFEKVLHGIKNVALNLDIDSSITGVSNEDLLIVIDYMYSGRIRFFRSSIINSLKALGCHSMVSLLAEFQQNVSDDLIIEDSDHANCFQMAMGRFYEEMKFCDCVLTFQDNSVIYCHRMVLCAFSEILEDILLDSWNDCEIATIDISSIVNRISSEDMKIIVEFMYTGRVNAVRKRYLSLREASMTLGVYRLPEILTNELVNGGQLQSSHSAFFGGSHLPSPQILPPSTSATDVSERCFDNVDYSTIYDAFVEGPARGKKLFCKTNNNKQRRTSSSTSSANNYHLSASSDHQQQHSMVVVMDGADSQMPTTSATSGTTDTTTLSDAADTTAMIVVHNNDRRRRTAVNLRRRNGALSEEFPGGYTGIPELSAHSNDVTVPLVVGNQKELMEKPFKCPYCEHRTKEKSAVEKHIRCIHTHEAPYRCNFCQQLFKVQSNLMRHIRTHTGEKPYICKKCGTSYADKKNMDAHVYREHLKMTPFHCQRNGCNAKFWRRDRFENHCQKFHHE